MSLSSADLKRHDGPSVAGVISLLCLIAAIAYIGRSTLGVASKPIQSALGLSNEALGVAMSAFFWSYALAQIPAGILGQRWGPRKALVIYALLGAACCALMASAVDFWSLVAVQVIFGISQAGLFPCAAQAIKHWIPPANRAFSSGSLGAAMSVGAFLGATITGYLFRQQFGWREVYLLYSPLGIVWSVMLLVALRPRETAIADQSAGAIGIGAALADLLGAKDMWMICGQQFFRAAGYSFFLTWFPQYLQNTRGVSVADSAYLTSVPLMGVVVGGLLGGYTVDLVDRITGSRRASRKGAAIVSTFGSAVFILAASRVTDAWGAVALIACGSFMGGLAGACAYTVTIDKAGAHVAPVFGVMNMAGNFGAAAFPMVVPHFLEAVDMDWNALLFLFAGIYIASGIFWCALNPEGDLFAHLNTSGPSSDPRSINTDLESSS